MKKILFMFVLVSICGILAVNAMAVTVDEAINQKNAIDALKDDAAQKAQQEMNSLNESIRQDSYLADVQQEKNEQYNDISNNIQSLEETITNLTNDIFRTQGEWDKKKQQVEERLKILYTRSVVSDLRYIINSKSITDLFQRINYLRKVYTKDKQMLEELQIAKAELDNKKQMAQTDKNDLMKQASSVMSEVNEIELNRQVLSERMQTAQWNLEYWKTKQDEYDAQAAELARFIMQSQYNGPDYSSEYMAWPVPGCGYITQYFGYFPHPILGDMRFHDGIDIGAMYGSAIVAANSGMVLHAGYRDDGYGYSVIIDHGGGVSTLYAHMAQQPYVSTGSMVEKGQVIGLVGSTGLSTGPHLHFTIYVNGVQANPLDYVSP